jgi:quercetin dioxygenase-like cupin family protein
MDRQEHSIGHKLSRRCLLGASGGMALLIGSCPAIAQRLLVTNLTEERETMDIKRGGHVTFEPGARSAWHTHPLGQTLIVTSGLGWAQCEGGPIEEIRPGDVIWFPAGVKHWHGAAATTAVTHIAVTEFLNGKNVDWMEKVSDEQYRK